MPNGAELLGAPLLEAEAQGRRCSVARAGDRPRRVQRVAKFLAAVLVGFACLAPYDVGGFGAWRTPSRAKELLAASPVGLAAGGGLVHTLLILVFTIAIIVGAAHALQVAVVKAVEVAIETFDRDYLGVDVNIGEISFNIFVGRLFVSNVKVDNPEGYSSDGLLTADTFILDLNMVRTILSLGREIEVTELKVVGVAANLEFNGYLWGKSNAMTILENLKSSTTRPKGDIQPVYDFWHSQNNEHTFHCEPAWPGEERKDVQFFAYTQQAPQTEPVYDFWNHYYQEHIFRIGESQSMLEKKGGTAHFYAFKEQVPGTEPVFEYWHPGNKEHTLHLEPAWPMEERGEIQFYAFRADPSGQTRGLVNKATLKPVYDFWHSSGQQHTFHHLPAWGGETEKTLQFYAYDKEVDGTEAVWDFWHAETGKKRFHIGEAAEGEVKRSPLFYVFTEQVADTEPVYEFYHEGNQEYNLHFGEAWEGEEKREVKFYAYREDPADRLKTKVFLKKVAIDEIAAQSSTKLAGMKVRVDDMFYDDFSTEFSATDARSVVKALMGELFGKVNLKLG